MDLSKFKPSDWMIVGGGLGFLIFGTLFDWLSLSFLGQSESGTNAFDFFLTGAVPWFLIVGAGVLTFLLAGGLVKATNVPWTLVILGATALGTLLVLLRLLFPGMGEDIPDEIDLNRGIGLWLSTISAIVATVGAALNFKASGGSMSDLTDPDKLRSSFRGPGGPGAPRGPQSSGGTPPPPPPPPPPSGPTPPPPPPPAP